jgi:hypothetical protein|tara:strand:+ start:1259 stop:1462 length:204 start_codon:yes stop_codon:yes gene_type:complete
MDNIEVVRQARDNRLKYEELRDLIVAGSPPHRSYPAESWRHADVVKRLKEIVPVGFWSLEDLANNRK